MRIRFHINSDGGGGGVDGGMTAVAIAEELVEQTRCIYVYTAIVTDARRAQQQQRVEQQIKSGTGRKDLKHVFLKSTLLF